MDRYLKQAIGGALVYAAGTTMLFVASGKYWFLSLGTLPLALREWVW